MSFVLPGSHGGPLSKTRAILNGLEDFILPSRLTTDQHRVVYGGSVLNESAYSPLIPLRDPSRFSPLRGHETHLSGPFFPSRPYPPDPQRQHAEARSPRSTKPTATCVVPGVRTCGWCGGKVWRKLVGVRRRGLQGGRARAVRWPVTSLMLGTLPSCTSVCTSACTSACTAIRPLPL